MEACVVKRERGSVSGCVSGKEIRRSRRVEKAECASKFGVNWPAFGC